MKHKRFQKAYRDNASRLHKKVGDLLREEKAFGDFEWYQEYPVNMVNDGYPDGRAKFDWVCPTLKIVVECHGKQHYQVVDFGYDSVEEAIEAFHEGKQRDIAKKRVAMDAGYTYMVVPYSMEKAVDVAWLQKTFSLQQEELEEYTKENEERLRLEEEQKASERVEVLKAEKKERDKQQRKEHLESEEHKAVLRKAREFRQQRYRKLKELKENARELKGNAKGLKENAKRR